MTGRLLFGSQEYTYHDTAIRLTFALHIGVYNQRPLGTGELQQGVSRGAGAAEKCRLRRTPLLDLIVHPGRDPLFVSMCS